MKRRAEITRAAASAALFLAVGACGGGGSSDNPAMVGGEPACTPSGPRLAISASNIEYDKTCLAAPPDQELTIVFKNEETLPHNVEVRGEQDTEVFKGDIVTGPKTVTYTVKGLSPGTYVFLCTVHPSQMRGTLVVK
jgi:hypothetical protein